MYEYALTTVDCVRKYLVVKITFQISNKFADLVPRLAGNTFEFGQASRRVSCSKNDDPDMTRGFRTSTNTFGGKRWN